MPSTYPKFNLQYRKKKGAFRALSAQEEEKFRSKLEHFEKMTLHEFLTGTAKPRIWHASPPDAPPPDLSKDIIDTGLYRINITRTARMFAYKKDEIFFVVSVDYDHKSG